MPGKPQTFQILHISDLHISTGKEFDIRNHVHGRNHHER